MTRASLDTRLANTKSFDMTRHRQFPLRTTAFWAAAVLVLAFERSLCASTEAPDQIAAALAQKALTNSGTIDDGAGVAIAVATSKFIRDLHHTPDDTFDKIKPERINQSTAAYVVFTYLAAELDGDYRAKVSATTK